MEKMHIDFNLQTKAQIVRILCRKALQTKNPEDEDKAWEALKNYLETKED